MDMEEEVVIISTVGKYTRIPGKRGIHCMSGSAGMWTGRALANAG
jgi:hypothetical protein